MTFPFAPPGRSAKRRRLPLALLASLAAIGLGCGGNVVVDHGGAGQGGGGGGTSSSSSMFGTPDAACLVSAGGIDICEQVFDASPTTVSSLKSACAGGGGKTIPACATLGVVGCCTIVLAEGKLEECFYSGLGVSEVQQTCQSQMGTFSTSP